MLNLKVKKLPSFVEFKQREDGNAGWDLYATEDVVIGASGWQDKLPNRQLVRTGISVSFDSGYYLRVAPRSGLAFKAGIDVLAGVIDSSYRGEIAVILINTAKGTSRYEVKRGDRIAQLIPQKISTEQFEFVEDLDETERGEGGFGSTGR